MIQPPYYHYRPHPWHGLDAGTSPPDLMNAYIEITPFDLVKYEVDKRVEVILETRVLGGLLMEDNGQADDKIVAVLKDDAIWSEARDISDLPARLVERMQHYFLTYKMRPGEQSTVQVKIIYGVERARTVVEASMADYREAFPA